MKWSRKDYMDGACSHADYYRSLNKTAGIVFRDGAGGISLDRVRAAIANGDEHLNTIPLAQWDNWAITLEHPLRRALKEHNGSNAWSLSDGVCSCKQAARDAV